MVKDQVHEMRHIFGFRVFLALEWHVSMTWRIWDPQRAAPRISNKNRWPIVSKYKTRKCFLPIVGAWNLKVLQFTVFVDLEHNSHFTVRNIVKAIESVLDITPEEVSFASVCAETGW